MDEGILGLGIIKGRQGKPRTDQQRKERHERIFGNTSLPARGSGKTGFGIIQNMQKRVDNLTQAMLAKDPEKNPRWRDK